MGAIISFLIGNPMVILAIIGVFTFTSIVSDTKAWFAERSAVSRAVTPLKAAIVERDRASAIKEQIAIEAIQSRENAKHEISALQAQLEAEEIKRKTAGGVDCFWSDNDVRVLNNGVRANATH